MGREAQGRLVRLQEWILLDGNRLVIASGLLVAILVVLVGLEAAGIASFGESEPVTAIFSSFIAGNLTLLTVVLSINQLVLSRELKSVGSLRQEIENIHEYRDRVSHVTGRETVPSRPSDFLRVIFEEIEDQAQGLDNEVTAVQNEQLRSDVDDLVETLVWHANRVQRLLERPGIGIFGVLSVTLSTNYAAEIMAARRVQTDYGADLPDSAAECLDRIVAQLENIDVARQYFKTLYMQQELAYLTRVLLYVGVPAEVASVVLLSVFADAEGAALLSTGAFTAVPLGLVVAFAPLAVLFAFLLRVATVAQRTATTAEFTTPTGNS